MTATVDILDKVVEGKHPSMYDCYHRGRLWIHPVLRCEIDRDLIGMLVATLLREVNGFDIERLYVIDAGVDLRVWVIFSTTEERDRFEEERLLT